MRSNFLIVSTGRTATKWLANIMNKGDFTVLHEPRGWTDDTFDKAKYAFYQYQSYGEVNGALRFDLMKFHKLDKGIIVREPKGLVVSFANRYFTKKLIKKIVDIHSDYQMFSKYHSLGVPIFKYEDMVSSVGYLQYIINRFGVIYECTEEDLNNKINSTTNKNYKTFDDLPDVCQQVFNSFNWNFNFLK